MKIVIDILKEEYDEILSSEDCGLHTLTRAVANGTPLPKGHGDLIDRSKLVPDCNELEIHDGDDWRNEYCGVSLMQIELYAEAIIEADRGDI